MMRTGKLTLVFLFSILLLASVDAQKPSVKTSKKHPCGDLMTQYEINRCAQDQYQKADAELNKVYQQTMAKLTPEHKSKLKEAQLAWIKFRDASCDCYAFLSEGGSIHSLIKYSCLESETQHRIESLKLLYQDVSR